jgi:hypothetical protein
MCPAGYHSQATLNYHSNQTDRLAARVGFKRYNLIGLILSFVDSSPSNQRRGCSISSVTNSRYMRRTFRSVIKGNNTTGRKGKLVCTECRKIRSKVFHFLSRRHEAYHSSACTLPWTRLACFAQPETCTVRKYQVQKRKPISRNRSSYLNHATSSLLKFLYLPPHP